ncbi:MAG: choice-of-anchor tandem repeat NxxGxxAF-containing protein [Gaiellaceae bacterium]
MIATTGERFSEFAPYVASVNDVGTVAFQAALRGGGTGVFTGSGEAVEEAGGSALLAGVTSHPDLNNAGAMSFYGDLRDGGQGVFLLRDGRLETVADTRGPFASIGPLGPTMNEAGTVAFRADRTAGVSGIFAADGATVATVADTEGPWSGFHGLPVINNGGTVVFRADRKDGVQGIYAGLGASIRTVAETGDLFETLAPFPSVNDHGTVAFAATLRAGGAGIFTVDEGRITQIIDADGAFETCRGALITSAGAVVCIATPRGGTLGLFAGPDPDADRILALGDALLGSTVSELASNPVSVNAVGHVAIRASLTDGRQLIMRADPIAPLRAFELR